MKVLNRLFPFAACVAAALAFAHGAGAHYKGAVKSATDKQLTLETEDKKEVVVALDEKTSFEKDGAAATAKDLALGLPVVVHTAKAEGSSLPIALVVKIGAAVTGQGDTGVQTLAISVTKDGFQPARMKVKKGQPLKLIVTRTTDQTCAKELVIDDPPQRAALPINQAVIFAFTPTKSGELKYGCGMGKMVSGVLLVE